MNLYKEEMLDHYRYPRNRGTLDQPDFCSGEVNPSCGDSVEITGKITDAVFGELFFTGTGCVISQATASMLVEHFQGKSIELALQADKEVILALIGIELGPTRLKCALLPLIALQQGIKWYQQKQASNA
jgi:nitrogen fixation NifU-like protein